MEENKNCYEYQKLTFNDGILNNSVDATYIIHLHGNSRHEDIQKQLEEYHPTNIVYIVINQGYEKCKKHISINKPAHDLTDAFLQIFKHSREQQYDNILILEDDFMFSEKVNDPVIRKDIDDYLNLKKTEKFVYYLGCIPYIQGIGYTNHSTLYLSLGTHACIYSKNMREHVLDNHNQHDIIDWDLFNNANIFYYNRYIYNKPLCYQLFPPTENSKGWFNPFGIAYIIKFILNVFSLDKQVEPGYSFFYTFSKVLFIFLVCMSIISNMYTLRWYGFQIRKKRGKNR